MVRIGSLYSGIAGLELGILAAFAEAGIPAQVAWQCEIDPFCRRVLAQHFPNVERFADVASVHMPPPVDLLCGGFMCTDVSSAGKGAGLGQETRSGFTWYHFQRIIGETRPRVVVVENVASGAKRWLPRVVQELGDRGYRPRAVPLGAVDVGAPHRRLRVFVVADRGEGGRRSGRGVEEHARQPDAGASGALAHGHGHGREGERRGGVLDGERAALGHNADGRGGGAARSALPDPERGELRDESGRPGGARGADAGSNRRPAEPSVGPDAHGLPFDVAGHRFPAGRGAEQHEWEPPRAVAHRIPERPARLRACGNAVVPQQGLIVGRIVIAGGVF